MSSAGAATSAVNRKSIRIALLLREAGILDEQHWQAYLKSAVPRTEMGVWEFLNQPVTMQMFRNVLLTDVKDLVPGRARPTYSESVLQPVIIRSAEVLSILKMHTPDVARLCLALIQHGQLSEEQLRDVLEEADRNALNIYEVLVATDAITPQKLSKVVDSGATQQARENRALLAGEFLIYNSLITKDDYSRVLDYCHEHSLPLWRGMQDLRVLSQGEMFQSLENMELPQVELIAYNIPSELLEQFPAEFMRRQSFVPLSVHDNQFELATDDPFNLTLADMVSLLTGRRVSLLYSRQDELQRKLETLLPRHEEPLRSMPPSVAVRKKAAAANSNDGNGSDNSGSGDSAARVRDYQQQSQASVGEPYVDNLDAVQAISRIIDTAIASRATDIHLEPMQDIMRVRYRVDGQLHNVMNVAGAMAPFIAARMKVLAQMNVTERRRPQDGRFDLETKNGFYDFRVSTMPSIHGEKIVLRLLDSNRVLTGLAQLGLDEGQMHVVEKLISRPHGLILVTGPTGSGKTSTLYACLSAVNREGINIITIEEPVEYQLDGITQVQVDPSIDLSFAAGLRSALRQDPDVIMVGEVRDPDTARTAVRASLTGHLVFSTLHTNTAAGAINALTNLEIQHYLVASSLTGIIAQRLVRVICEHCKKSFNATKGILAELGLPPEHKKKFYRGAGCDHCLGTGYMGRTGLFQVVEVTDSLRRALSERRDESELNDLPELSQQTLMESGVSKVLQGITTPAEVLKAVSLNG